MLAATFVEVFGIVVGVLLALAGLAVALMGGIAMTEGAGKRGGYALLVGVVLLGVGLWLIGALG
jgi:hypothetical protein